MKLRGYAAYRFKRDRNEISDWHSRRYFFAIIPVFFIVACIIFYLDLSNFVALIVLFYTLAFSLYIANEKGRKKAKDEVVPENYKHPLSQPPKYK